MNCSYCFVLLECFLLLSIWFPPISTWSPSPGSYSRLKHPHLPRVALGLPPPGFSVLLCISLSLHLSHGFRSFSACVGVSLILWSHESTESAVMSCQLQKILPKHSPRQMAFSHGTVCLGDFYMVDISHYLIASVGYVDFQIMNV